MSLGYEYPGKIETYILKDDEPIECPDVRSWTKWINKKGSTKVKRTTIKIDSDKEIIISTRFTGIAFVPHNKEKNADMKHLFFETLIIGGEKDKLYYKYYTMEEAIASHNRLVKMIRAGNEYEIEEICMLERVRSRFELMDL